jgi:prolyl-tRNA synthetase
MGCYGIGVGRLLAAAIEQHHDDDGMVLPASIAPYDVWLVALNVDKEDVAEAADTLYKALTDEGIQVLYDDRQESAGVKFNDADLVGLPVRLVVSPRNLRQNAVEVKLRSEGEAATVALDQAVVRVRELLTAQ